VASFEASAESASFGSLVAKAQACRAAKKTEEVAKETAAARFLASKKDKDVPWYFQPFMFLAKGIVAVENTDTYKTYKEYKTGLDEKQFAKENPAVSAGAEGTSSITDIAHNAAYAEEMIVDVVTEVIQKWKNGSRNVTEEINNFNKSDSDSSGIMKFFKAIGAEELAIRYAVRSLIRINAVQVDAFMTSGFGRFVMYAYNVYFYYKTIAENQAQVEYAKEKITILDKAIKNFETKTSWLPVWKNLYSTVLPEAYAEVLPTQYIIPRPPCLTEIIPNCSLSSYNYISNDIKAYYNALPKDAQVTQNNLLGKSYAFKSALGLASGKVGYENIDVAKLQSEIKMLENYSEQLEKKHPKSNEFVAHYNDYLNKMKKETIFPESVMAVYNKDLGKGDVGSFISKDFDRPTFNNPKVHNVSIPETAKADLGMPISSESTTHATVDYEIETIYTKEQNLFDMITNRYIQIYQRKELVE
jgi:hypothetical protein